MTKDYLFNVRLKVENGWGDGGKQDETRDKGMVCDAGVYGEGGSTQQSF